MAPVMGKAAHKHMLSCSHHVTLTEMWGRRLAADRRGASIEGTTGVMNKAFYLFILIALCELGGAPRPSCR